MLKAIIKNNPTLWGVSLKLHRWTTPFFKNPFFATKRYFNYFRDRRKYIELGGNAKLIDAYPCLFDKSVNTPFDPQYFYQAVWAATKINKKLPETHVDVGSDIKFVGMLSAICKVEFVDIRPLQVNLSNFKSIDGSILNLPYQINSIPSLSCMHVIEHIGLGRYGDPIDPQGVEKACIELQRVLAINGYLYLSVPIGSPRVQFNGQRVMSIGEVIKFLPNLSLLELSLVDNNGIFHPIVNSQEIIFDEKARSDFALGCFIFTKNC